MTPSPEKRGREGARGGEEMERCSDRHQTVAISTGGELSQTTTPRPETPGAGPAAEASRCIHVQSPQCVGGRGSLPAFMPRSAR
ncbi:hypothetical protein CMUS01_01192 [Colletotrichum musicola]|uniref:Uncharacterized protein n=1 Tax=Colletotrichum musicola TaxID=2175873 RepID=A0A8H6NX88_9PEZI|nr:hypothetical protein CMUS01_01192 [Colletotrichum musicola]